MDLLQTFGYESTQWLALIAAALILGFSKTGINGMFMLAVIVAASAFGSKESTGILAPMLITGDVFAVTYYHRHAEWKQIRNLLPWLVVGLFVGVVVGSFIDAQYFRYLIGGSVLVCLIIMIYSEGKGGNLNVPENLWFYALTGIAAGFTTMVGNAGGPVLTIYLLAKGFSKTNYLGTITWIFFITNLLKIPLQVFFWHNITLKTAAITGLMIPAVAIGAFAGILVVKRLNEKPFRYVIIAATALTAFKLML